MITPELLEAYRDFSLNVRKLAPKTVSEYIRVLQAFPQDLLKVSGPAEIDQLIIDLSNKNNFEDIYTYKHSAILKTFYQWAHYKELTPKNLYDYSKIRKPGRKEVEFLTQGEFDFVNESIKDSPFLCDQDRTLFYVLWDTGLRRSECAALDREDVLLNDSVIRLPKIKAKGKNKSRFLPYTPRTAQFLMKQLEDSERFANGNHVFLNEGFGRMSAAGIWSRLHKIAQIADRAVRPHMLRHSLGIRILDNGGDIGFAAKLLGHDSLNTTLHYLNAGKESTKNQYNMALCNSL